MAKSATKWFRIHNLPKMIGPFSYDPEAPEFSLAVGKYQTDKMTFMRRHVIFHFVLANFYDGDYKHIYRLPARSAKEAFKLLQDWIDSNKDRVDAKLHRIEANNITIIC